VLAAFGILACTLLLSVMLGALYLRVARRRQLLDLPNERSSHSAPTPHGGGVALITAFMLGLLLATWLYGKWDSTVAALSVAALILTVVGILDDLRGLSVRLRLFTYSIVCLCVAYYLLQPAFSELVVWNGLLVFGVAFTMLWTLNLYNFMDGIDGIAALQAVLACCGAALVSWVFGQHGGYALVCLLLASAHAGFLAWNWPPARLFMGDAGSVPTGFLVAALALWGAVQGLINPLCWLVLLAGFIADSSLTLLQRIRAGQDFTQPHRQHAYQRLSRHWDSHLRVDVVLAVINIFWLIPLACAIQAWPELGLFLVLLAYLPLVFGVARSAELA
jgi:Fuc2NAc and GlcNAc transferase